MFLNFFSYHMKKENCKKMAIVIAEVRVSDLHFFFADPDPGKNLHAGPDPWGIRGRALGVSDDS